MPCRAYCWPFSTTVPPKCCLTLSQGVLQYVVLLSFKHKGLAELFEHGRSRGVRQDLQARCLRRLETLDNAESLRDLEVPGCNFHALRGRPRRYSIHVNGPWCITFEWDNGDAVRVDLEQYH
jgi:toxin HigB-1